MATPPENISMALFCDFENVALGVRDANYEKFDIKPVLERLLLKGSIVVKKAYCDWERYKGFKATMHEANFELIEIPHVRQSGKNSADIRLVVDALDLCYTKSHVNTFVIISGDSDFSPLVSKLRENNKQVIGVGVKQSTSDLLIANCDEFIFYDDLVREKQRALARRQQPADAAPATRRSPEEEHKRKEAGEARRNQAIELAVETFDALMAERGDSGKIWASVLKEAIKRRRPDFNENYFGFRAFGNLLEEAQARGLMEFGRDEKSGAYVFRSSGVQPRAQATPAAETAVQAAQTDTPYERPVSRYFPQEALAPAPAAVAPMPRPEHGHDAAHDEQPPESYDRPRGGRRDTQQGRRAEQNPRGRAPHAHADISALAGVAAEAEARARARQSRELRERQAMENPAPLVQPPAPTEPIAPPLNPQATEAAPRSRRGGQAGAKTRGQATPTPTPVPAETAASGPEAAQSAPVAEPAGPPAAAAKTARRPRAATKKSS